MSARVIQVFKKAVVFGAGAVGSIIGARLSNVMPTLLVGRKKHVQMLRKRGLKIGGAVNETVRVKAALELPDDLSSTLLLITAKTTSLESMGKTLAQRLSPTTTVVIACNGYRPEEHLRKTLPKDAVIHRVLVTAGAHMTGPGSVDYWGGGGIDLPDTHIGRTLGKIFSKAGFTVEYFKDFDFAVWRKLAANCVINPLTALLRVRNRMIIIPELDAIRRGIVEECRTAALTDGVNLPLDYAARLDKFTLQSNNVSSMLQDVLKGRPTEIDDLNGAVARLGAERGIPTPLNSLFTALVKAVTATGPEVSV